ncbi:MAG TPA: peptidoglycan editing factor PgeF [Clostridiales bacterium]|nr:peptidoglycan editing factor PgeF [Clostridiales bacterium]
MIFKNSDAAQLDLDMEVPFITFPVLSDLPFIKHGFSTRLGGVSEGMFSTMNFGSETSPYLDDPANIEENYRRMADSIGFDVNKVVISLQVHKTNIRLVEERDYGKGLFVPRDYDEIDGLVTNRPGITLVTKYADCVPLYLVDPVKKAIGLSHSGWRGTVLKIGKVTVEELQKNFGSHPSDLIAVIGPSICRKCYEISEEVAEEFKKAFPGHEKSGILTHKGDGKYLCDLWSANREVFLEAGLSPDHIHISGVCTACNSELLFSHRKTQGKRGNLGAFLTIAE